MLRVRLEQLGLEEHLQVRVRDAPIPRVRNVPSVHDLAKVVLDIGPGHLVVVAQIVEEHLGAHRQVAVVERVRAREALESKLAPAERERVEEAEREEHRAEGLWLGRGLERLLAKEGVRAAQVGLEVRGRLVGHLDRRLQDALGHRLLRGQRRRLGRQVAAEVVVARLGRDLERAFKLGQPRLHQVDVLQKEPAALGSVLDDRVLGILLLALTHRNRLITAVGLCEAELLAELLNVAAGVDAREEHKEERRGRGRVLVCLLHVERGLVDVTVAHHDAHESGHRRGHAVGAHDADEQQALEERELLLPLARQLPLHLILR